MRPTPTILLPALALAAAAAAKPQACTEPSLEDRTFCERGVALCDIAQSWDDCSELYIASMKA